MSLFLVFLFAFVGCSPSANREGAILILRPQTNNDNDDIFLVDLASGAETNLTNTNDDESQPVWSPDGIQIAYISKPRRNSEYGSLYIMNADGSNPHKISEEILATAPNWSPDGTQLVFGLSRVGEKAIAIINMVDGEIRDIVSSEDIVTDPKWSPDGRYIAYRHVEEGSQALSIVDLDGNLQTELDGNSEYLEYDWAPDSSRLVVGSDRNNEARYMYVLDLNAQGNNLTQISPGLTYPSVPKWSLDGKQIVFLHRNTISNGNNNGFWRVDPNGENFQLLSQGWGDLIFSWSPDRTRIAFYSVVERRNELFIMNVDGSGATQITKPIGFNRALDDAEFPQWKP